jgi:hypothetical protein
MFRLSNTFLKFKFWVKHHHPAKFVHLHIKFSESGVLASLALPTLIIVYERFYLIKKWCKAELKKADQRYVNLLSLSFGQQPWLLWNSVNQFIYFLTATISLLPRPYVL